VRAFHRDSDGGVRLVYYPQVITHAGLFAFPLLAEILECLETLTDNRQRARLSVLRQSLLWQQTIGKMR
jgi:hypothetical protein